MSKNVMECRYLQGAEHVGLKELLVGEGMIDEGPIVNDGVQSLRQLLVYVRIQPQLGL